MKQALILHGTDATPESNWFAWLKERLQQDGYQVWLPLLPDNDRPNAKTYTDFLLSNPDFAFDNETIIIGHSSGAVEVLHLLQNLPENVKIKDAFLVSAFKDDLGWDMLKGLFGEPFDFAKIKSKADKIVFFHSDNDPYCPLEHAEYLAGQVDGKLIVRPGQGHFNTEISDDYKSFPALMEVMREEEQDI